MHPSGHVLDGGDLHSIPGRTDSLCRPAAADNLQDYAFCHPNFSVLGLAAFIANLSSLVNRSFWLQVLLFPLQAGGSVLGEETHVTSPVLYLPLLRAVVEFDVAGPGDLKACRVHVTARLRSRGSWRFLPVEPGTGCQRSESGVASGADAFGSVYCSLVNSRLACFQ